MKEEEIWPGEELQIAWYPPCQSDHIASPDQGVRHPWRPGSHSSGGGPRPPAALDPLPGEGVQTSSET